MSQPAAEQATIAHLLGRIDQLTHAVQALCTLAGARLGRQQLAERWGIHRNTLAARMDTDRTIPRPGKDGKWLLSEIIEWEQHHAGH